MADAGYRAFVSYSHQSDARLAASLQSSLTRFAKPWYRLRSMRIFQDTASLSATPGLWSSIEQALSQSEYFLLLACPASAESRWVQQELHWWIQNRSVERLILCLTDGEILWDNQTRDFDWQRTSAISSSFKGVFPAEPLYADFRAARTARKWNNSDPDYRGALLDVAAPLLGRPKDELDGEDIRLHRRARGLAAGIGVLIVALAVVSAASFSTARKRQTIASSRALASEAVSHVADRSLALLLSIEARRIADTVESRRALLTSIQRLPGVEAFLWGHSDAVSNAVLSPDGKTILSAGWNNRIWLWDAATHRPAGPAVSTDKGLVSVAFNADGSQFASSADGSVMVWETASRKPACVPFTARESFVHLGFSPSGKFIAASTDAFGGNPSTIYLWEMASHRLDGSPIAGSTFAFAPNDTVLAIGQFEKLTFFNLKTHRFNHAAMGGLTKTIAAIAFDQDGSLVAAGSEDGAIAVWDVRTGKLLGTLAGGSTGISALLFDPAGQLLFSGSQDGTVTVWDLETFTAADTPLRSFGASISSMVLQSHGKLKALALDKNGVVLLDVSKDPPLGLQFQAPDSSGSNIAFSPDGRTLASSGEFGTVVLWDVATRTQSGPSFSGHQRQVSRLTFSPDGKQLMSGAMDGTVILWDTATRQPLAPPDKAFSSPVWSMAASPDGKTLVAGSDARIAFWDLSARRRVAPAITAQKDRIWNLAFSPSGDLMASAGNNHVIDLWNMGSVPTLVRTFGTPAPSNDFEVMPVGEAFSPDGTLLASATQGHTITLWRVKNGQPLAPLLYGHTEAIQSLVFSGDGRTLASASADGDIRLWDVESRELVGILRGSGKAVNGLTYDGQKELLASVDADNAVTLWDADFSSWERVACRIANRNLTRTEWNTYLGTRTYRATCPTP